MIFYIGLGIAVMALLIMTYLNSAVYGDKPKPADMAKGSNYKDGVFHNQSLTEVMSPDGSFFKVLDLWINKKAKDNTPKSIIPVIKTDLKALDLSKPSIIWFGHSSYLLIIDGKKILVDPVFSRASPVPVFGKPYLMSYDYTPDDFPEIDVLVITHDHYDHLDYKTFKALLPKVKNIVTSAGVDSHLILWGANKSQIISLFWNESCEVGGLAFTALPARHFSGRKFKRGETLWSSFALKADNLNIYLGGDSGFDTHFEEIGKNYGPFDLVILECGQYGQYWPKIHMLPEEMILAAQQLGAKAVLPVHWAKFSLAVHGWTEPIDRALIAAKKLDISLLTPQIGKQVLFEERVETPIWWRF